MKDSFLNLPSIRVCPCAWVVPLFLALSGASVRADDWLQFRGNHVDGLATGNTEAFPKVFDGEKSIAWKIDLPGQGVSSPLIVDGRVIVTCSSGTKEDRLHVICFDEKDGAKKWERQFWATGRTMCHEKTAVAGPTPTCDGKRIFALFSSNDLIALDLDGNLLWMRGLTVDYPNASNSLGLSTSPVIADGTLVVQIENDSESFAAGIDPDSGINIWKIERTKRANWCSPVVMGKNVVLQGSAGLDAVEAKTGTVVWSLDGGASTIPSSVVGADGTLYSPANGLTALKPNSSTTPDELWQVGSLRPGTASPIVIGDKVFVINTAGVINAARADNGEKIWNGRLEGTFSGSPVAAGNFIYVFSESGLGQVMDLSVEEGKVTGTVDLGEMILCTPALANGAVFVRSDAHLWKLR